MVSASNTSGAANSAPNNVPELIAALASPSPVTRRRARTALVAIGKPTVLPLIQLLSHRKTHVRWEAAKALGHIGDPIAALALVKALEDRDGDVRWLAAEGLVALGPDALAPLLAALMEPAESDCLYAGAHHVCHALVKRKKLGPILRPVLAALGESEPETAAPLAAYTALARFRERRHLFWA
jgi:HEAT repeat protein